jgi:hypothetical protein
MLTASMQLFKHNLASSEMMTIIGGFLGSLQFIFILTVNYSILNQYFKKYQ